MAPAGHQPYSRVLVVEAALLVIVPVPESPQIPDQLPFRSKRR